MTKTANVTLQSDFGWYQDAGATTPESFPSGENQEGKTFSYNPNSGLFELRHPKIFFGPMAMTDGSTGPITFGTTWTTLATGIPADGIGMRGGMAAYVPKGRYGVKGFVAVASAANNTTVHLRVVQGSVESNASQPRIAAVQSTPVVVGEGVGTCFVANYPHQISFLGTDIQYAGAANHACEILIQACTSTGTATALASTGSTNIATRGETIRWDGLFGIS